MQDEINEKVVALSVKGAKLTAEMLQKAIKAMLAQAKKQQEKQPHGKQTLTYRISCPMSILKSNLFPNHCR